MAEEGNMYTIKNGILHKDNKACIGMGVGYYASFHPYKYAVPPEGDRIGEMKKDLPDMAKLGFNVLRTSALGEVKWEDKQVKMSFPFVDEMMKEAESQDLAVLMRIHNYSMAIRHNQADVAQIDEKGNKQLAIEGQCAYVSDCVNHQGVIADNELTTEKIAEHFSKFPNVVMHLIYNEPAYAYGNFHDYHPESIKAYRKWLVEKGLKTEEEVKDLDAPRRRPLPGEDDSDWINFRMFSTEAMSKFLCNINDYCKKGNPHSEAMTCMMPVMLKTGGVKLGEDLFALGDGMDIIGVTDYLPCFGQQYYFSLLYGDVLGSSAAMNNKHIWAAECNAHSTLTAEEWQRETYTLLGLGFKGLIYYQWRADYDNKKGPEIGLFGIVRNDRTPTEKYDIIRDTNALVAKVGETLATSEVIHSNVGILFSHHANAYFDAHENGYVDIEEAWNAFDNFNPGQFIYTFDRNVLYLQYIHREIRQKGIAPCVVRASDLKENKLNLDVLIVPSAVGLSDDEMEMINNFAKSGKYVFIYYPGGPENGYILSPHSKTDIEIHRHYKDGRLGHPYSMDDIIYVTKVKNSFVVKSEDNTLGFNVLQNNNSYTVAITNFDTFERTQKNGVIEIDEDINVKGTAVMHTVTRKICILGKKIGTKTVFNLPEIHTGAFIIIDK